MQQRFITAMALLALLTSSLLIPTVSAQQSSPVAQRAMQAYRSGQLPEATRLFEQVVQQNPGFANAWYNLGSLQYRQKHYDKSRAAFERVLSINGQDHQARYNLALALEKLGRTQDARTILTQIPSSHAAYGSAQKKLAVLPKPTVATKKPITRKAAASATVSGPRKAAAFARQLSGPTGMALGPSGEVYVANYSKNSIVKVTPEGRQANFVEGGGLHGPIGLVRDPRTGDLFVANYLKDNILRVTPQGKTSIVAKDLQKPYNLLLDSLSNTLYVSEQGTNQVSRIQL